MPTRTLMDVWTLVEHPNQRSTQVIDPVDWSAVRFLTSVYMHLLQFYKSDETQTWMVYLTEYISIESACLDVSHCCPEHRWHRN